MILREKKNLRVAGDHESVVLENVRLQDRLERICRESRAVYRHQLANLRLQGTVGPVNIKDLALSHVVDVVPSVPCRDF